MAQVRAALAGPYLYKELKHTTMPIYIAGREFLKEGQLWHLVHKILLKISIFFSWAVLLFAGRNLLHDLVFLSERTSHTHEKKNPKNQKTL